MRFVTIFILITFGASVYADAKDVNIVNQSVDVTVLNQPAVQDVQVVNQPTVQNVQDVDNPALTPFQASKLVTVVDGSGGLIGTEIVQVDENKRLVVEYVSVRCTSEGGAPIISTSVNVTRRNSPSSTSSTSFEIPIRFQGNFSNGDTVYVGGLTTRFYADSGFGGTALTSGILRGSSVGDTHCFFAVSGHTIDL